MSELLIPVILTVTCVCACLVRCWRYKIHSKPLVGKEVVMLLMSVLVLVPFLTALVKSNRMNLLTAVILALFVTQNAKTWLDRVISRTKPFIGK